jgi:hypothetical protein
MSLNYFDLNYIWNNPTRFSKIANIQFHEYPLRGSVFLMTPDRQAGRQAGMQADGNLMK